MKCTYCKGTEFLEGPSGGLSVNVLCANEKCRHWFNLVLDRLEDLHRVEPTKEEKSQFQKDRDREAADLREETRLQGVQIYADSQPASACIQHTNNNCAGFYQAAGDDIVRLAGWLDAMKENEKPVITNVYCFNNGMTLVFDQFGKQMPEYQGTTEEMVPKIRLAGYKGELVHGSWK